jgi:hypothetical protein
VPRTTSSKKPAEVVVATRIHDNGTRTVDARIVSVRRGVIPIPVVGDVMRPMWYEKTVRQVAKAWARELGVGFREETRL